MRISDWSSDVCSSNLLIGRWHHILAKGANMTGNSAGHAEPGVCVYVRRPNEALHQLVGDIIILRQQLAGNIEGHTVRPVTGNSVGKALGHLTDRPVPAYAPPPDFRIE